MRSRSDARGGILVTGAGGFVGRALISALKAEDPSLSITGVGRSPPAAPLPIDAPFVTLDLLDAAALAQVVARVRPATVVHLAALSSVQQAQSAPVEMWRSNLDATINLAEAVRAHAPEATLIFSSSAECYGRTFASGEPLTEDASLQPMNAYARSKVAGEYVLRDLHTAGRLVILRMFNQIGPGQDERFVSSSFAAQIARIERGEQSGMKVGDLTAERDFCDIEDMLRALTMLIEAADRLEQVSVFNVCSGQTRSVRSVLDGLIALSDAAITVAVDAERLRPSSIPRAAGAHDRLTEATGWRPRISFDETLVRLMTYWRESVR